MTQQTQGKEIFDRDFRDICTLLYEARSFEKAEIALFYAAAMCRNIGAEVRAVRLDCGAVHPEFARELPPEAQLFAKAMWKGFADALMTGGCHVIKATVRTIADDEGGIAAAELIGVATDERYARSFKGYSVDYYYGQLPENTDYTVPVRRRWY